jgi:predicted dehydrogenase
MTSKWVEDITWDPKEDQQYYHNTQGQNLDIIKRVLAGQPPMTSARDAYETMKVVEAAELSANQGKPISLDTVG